MAKEQEYWRWPEGTFINPNIDWKRAQLITTGVDVGSVSSQAVVLADGELYAFSNTRTGSDSPESAKKAVDLALEYSDMTSDDFDYCIGTGYGRVNVPMAQRAITEIACHGRGANFMHGPGVRTILDMGGQDCKAIRVDDKGRVLNFMMNDKCASGTGRGMEVFANLIRLPVWQMGPCSYETKGEIPAISSTCVVFAKTEIIGLLEEGWEENNIIAAYCAAMAHRAMELLNLLGVEEKFVITGGIAKNEGVVRRLEDKLGKRAAEKVWPKPEYSAIPFDSQIAGALGASLFAYAIVTRGKEKSVRKKNRKNCL